MEQICIFITDYDCSLLRLKCLQMPCNKFSSEIHFERDICFSFSFPYFAGLWLLLMFSPTLTPCLNLGLRNVGLIYMQGLPRWLNNKESTYQCRRRRRYGFDPWVGKISWRGKWKSTPGFLPVKSPNLMDRGAWWAPVHKVVNSQTRLSD